MPIHRVTTIRKRLADPKASCGREITTTRVGRSKRAWWACGPAVEKFEQDIEQDLGALLRNVGLGYADIYVRLYMIGSQQETARPIIMICCLDSSVRSAAESSIRRSGVLKKYPEFGIGASALPLEQPVRARALASEVAVASSPPSSDITGLSPLSKVSARPLAKGDVLAASHVPEIGRQLFSAAADGSPSRSATGGAVIWIRDRCFQMTVGHIDESEETTPPPTSPPPEGDLEECYFDGQSDDEDEGVDFDFDYEVTGRGSITPVERSLRSWADSVDGYTEVSQASTSGHSPSPRLAQGSRHPPAPSPPQFCTPRVLNSTRRKAELQCIGSILHHSRHGPNPALDYSLVPLASPPEGDVGNRIRLSEDKNAEILYIRATAAAAGNIERRIVAVTAAGGVTRGTLLPGATYFRKATSAVFLRLYAVQLDGMVVEGDCGSVVVDEKSGHLYGHIVRGCSGTQIAYIVAATEVFEDLQSRLGSQVSLTAPQSGQEANHAETEQRCTVEVKNSSKRPSHRDKTSMNPPPHPRPAVRSAVHMDVDSTPKLDGAYAARKTADFILDPADVPCPPEFDMYPHPHPGDSGPSSCSSTASTLSSSIGSPRSKRGYLLSLPEWGIPSYMATGLASPWEGLPSFSDHSFASDVGLQAPMAFEFPTSKSLGFVDPSLIHPEISRPTLGYEGHLAYPESPLMQPGKTAFFTKPPLYSSRKPPYLGTNESPYHAFHLPDTGRRLSVALKRYGEDDGEDEVKEKGRCHYPGCGKMFKDLKAHMLTHQNDRPEKCPVRTCDYHVKGFARKYDKNRHTLTHYKGTMVCGFCPGSGSAAEKSFNRADVFKRHLTSVHGVQQTPPNSRKKSSTAHCITGDERPGGYAPDATGKCSTCSLRFSTAQDFYEHLDECVLRIVMEEDPGEAIRARHLAEVESDPNVRDTLEKAKLPINAETMEMETGDADEMDEGGSPQDEDGDKKVTDDSARITSNSPYTGSQVRRPSRTNPPNGVRKSRKVTMAAKARWPSPLLSKLDLEGLNPKR